MTRRKHLYQGDTAVLFPDQSIPGAVFFNVKFVFMGYHPTDGEFEKSFSGRVKTRNQDEAILKALDRAVQLYPHYFFQYREGPRIGSGAYLVYRSRDTKHIFVRASSGKEKARSLAKADKGDPCFFIRVNQCLD